MDEDGNDPSASSVGLFRSACRWWNDIAASHSHFVAARRFVIELWEFVRDSTPPRRRLRYGDADFDWDHRVDTTSGSVTWRNRLWGIFHSPYQPTEAALFHEMLSSLREQTGCEFSDFIFLDLGSGKGRALLMASDYPFQRIVGVELLPELHLIAEQNLLKYNHENQKCFALQSICADAAEFDFPSDPIVLYLFNPLPEAGLRRVIANLEQSLRSHPRKAYVIYHNPLLEHVLRESATWGKIGGTHQYAIYEAQNPA
jgi:SAM-dependent methyltransferase